MNQFPMSSFTVGLAIIGGILLAVLVAWNTWSTRRNTPRQPLAPATPADPQEPDRSLGRGQCRGV